ncbi:MAG: hypothetical protein VB027_06640 [Gordonibacter sp.]|nr:hypothetical protein [Gordonibacter sp.]
MVARMENWVNTDNLEFNKLYTYRELCLCLGVKAYGNSNDKRKQYSVWEQFFRWEKPSRREYVIVEIYDERRLKEDRRTGNGGARKGAGRLEKLPDEFACLLNGFLYERAAKALRESSEPITVYFYNKDICSYFGIYAGGIFDAYEKFEELIKGAEKKLASNHPESNGDSDRKTRVEFALWDAVLAPDRVYGKLAEKRENLIYKKIRTIGSKNGSIVLEHGINAFKDPARNQVEHHDEWLARWDELKEEFKRKKGIPYDGLIKKRWHEMELFVTTAMIEDGTTSGQEYALINKPRKITFHPSFLKEHDPVECAEARERFRTQVAEDTLTGLKEAQNISAESFISTLKIEDDGLANKLRCIDMNAYMVKRYLGGAE